MKKISPWLIVVWVLVFVLALATGLVGSFSKFPALPLWICAAALVIGDAVWLFFSLTVARKRRASAKPVITGNQSFGRIMRETEEAVARYTEAANRHAIFRKATLQDRPWFILCGTAKSGKSSLLNGSGLTFPMCYPSEKDGLLVEGSDQIMWRFANEAVWIDTPGTFMEEGGQEGWQALIAALRKVRPGNPADGVAMVVNTNEVLNTDEQGIKDLARRLRSRIDELITLWGIEFPVYLLFNRTDEVPGFKEYFADQLERGGSEQIFGATIPAKMLSSMPRAVFIEEFNLLCRSLTDLRLDKLLKERSGTAKRMICRFVIHFEGIQQKLGSLVAELFKPSNYEGKPLFRGFYFTSCTELVPRQSDDAPTPSSDMSMTIANHPLNPNRAFSPAAAKRPAETAGAKRKVVKSAFVLPLFREIMVRDKALVKSTLRRTRREMVRHYTVTGAVFALAALLCLASFYAYRKNDAFVREIGSTLGTMPPQNAPLMDQYRALDVIHSLMMKLQKYQDKGTPVTMGIKLYHGGEILAELKQIYFNRLRRFMVVPAVKYLEYDLRGRTTAFGELAGDDYDNLYRTLKAYLSISEGGPRDPKRIDTLFLRDVLLNAIKQSIVATVQSHRLPSQVELILQDNMGLYLQYLCRNEFPRIQENLKLVSSARKRLSRLPGAEALYGTIIHRLSTEAPRLTLDEILKRQGEGILKSDLTISALYTGEGWEQYVSDAINEAARNPFKADWVIGLSKDDLPESAFDTRQLRSDMTAAYLLDFRLKWLEFLGSVGMEPFGDLQRSSRILQKLAADRSETAVLLEAVAGLSEIKQQSEAGAAAGAALDAASKFKATKKSAEKVNKLREKSGFKFKMSSPFDDHNAFFDIVRSFVRSGSAASLGGYEGYRDRLLTLAEKCASIDAQNESRAITVFNGKEDDPLLGGWNFTHKSLNGMPEELAAALRNTLLAPFEYTGDAASRVLTRTLNQKWQQEIIKPFTNRFSGRYPFTPRGEEASFTDVMDFFRPTNGTFWGFYDRVLSSFITKEGNSWGVRQLGSLKLRFNPAILASLSSAERIRNIFFKDDGTLRALDITIVPSAANKNSARLIIGTQELELKPGGRSVKLKWPLETDNSATLQIIVSSTFTQEITKSGQWGFMKLLQMGRRNRMNNSTINVKWQINVQNQYMVFVESRVQVAGSDHPFSDDVFESFDCPTELLTSFAEEGAADAGAKSASVDE